MLSVLLLAVLPVIARGLRVQAPPHSQLWSLSNQTAHDGRPLQRLWDGRLAFLDLDPLGPGGDLHRQRMARTRERWAVCIIGQLSRLELDSKIKNLFQDLESSGGVQVDAFVVLETGPGYFVNQNTNVGGPICQTAFTPERVKADLSPWYAGGAFIEHNDFNDADPRAFPGYDKPWINRTKRLQLHFNQWTHAALCADLVQQALPTDNYSGFLRIRDSSIVVQAFKPQDPSDRTQIQVKNKNGWGGYNDKVLFAPGPLIKPALTLPLELARAANAGDANAACRVRLLRNPEQILKESLRGLPVKLVEAQVLPFVDGRCHEEHATAEYCLVPAAKDDHPKGLLFAKTCKGKF